MPVSLLFRSSRSSWCRAAVVALAPLLALMPQVAVADFPIVEKAQLDGARLSVTLSHPDTGWEHYADGWEVLLADSTSLGVRELAHPHVQEQPFTRSLNNISVPEGTDRLFIRARCNQDGWSDQLFELPLK